MTAGPARFGTDGVRGRAGVDLTASVAARLGRAVGTVLPAGPAVIGGDTRESTPELTTAVARGLIASGRVVEMLGVASTPLVAHRAAATGAIGVVVSASHNPYHDNGIKVFGPGGRKLDRATEQLIEEACAAQATDPPPVPVPAATPAAAEQAYLDMLAAALGGGHLAGTRIVLDAAHGAASGLAARALAAVGAEGWVINAAPDGRNINASCGATSPSACAQAVLGHGAHMGLALDGDADRVIAVDERGAVVDGDRIIALCALDLQARGELPGDTVVVTVMSNLGFRRAMEAAGIEVVETPVGDREVSAALEAGGFGLGGEQSGHVILRRHALTGDGLLTGLVLADLCRRAGRPLSLLAAQVMERVPQVLVNVPLARPVPGIVDLLAEEIAAAARAVGPVGRVLVRPSGTEPLLRVMVEADDAGRAQAEAERLARAVAARWG